MSYAAENTQTTVKITMLKNPDVVRQTKTFGVTVLDKDQYGVAEVKANAQITYTPTAGNIEEIKLESLGSYQIQDQVSLRLSFKPQHTVEIPKIQQPGKEEGTLIDSDDAVKLSLSQRLEIKLPN